MEKQIWMWIDKVISNETKKIEVIRYIKNNKWDSLEDNKKHWEELCDMLQIGKAYGLYSADAKDFKLLLKNYIIEYNGGKTKDIILHDWGILTLDEVDIQLGGK
jgi:hypothetical protein